MNEPLIIGLYGISGSGKSHALTELEGMHPEWQCLEGSKVIEAVLQKRERKALLEDFKQMTTAQKDEIRKEAAQWIKSSSPAGVTIVAGHCSFPNFNANKVSFDDVFSESDGQTYTAIVYLNANAERVIQQRCNDSSNGRRVRSDMSKEHLQLWMDHEQQLLKQISKEHNIPFHNLPLDAKVRDIEQYVYNNLISDVVQRAQKESTASLKEALRTIPSADVFLLIDGDRTMWPGDTGRRYFGNLADRQKAIFQRYDTYTFQAFWENAMLFLRESDYFVECKRVSNLMILYPDWVRFLRNLPGNVHPVLVTSGVREAWEAALLTNDLNGRVSLMAGNRLSSHPYIVDSMAKQCIAFELRKMHPGCSLLAFGDSEIDVPMMTVADRSYIVLDDRQNRSMESWIRQLQGTSNGTSRCSSVYQLAPSEDNYTYHAGIRVATFDSIVQLLGGPSSLVENTTVPGTSLNDMIDFSDNLGLQMLATRSRRADLHGPALQEVHRQIGARMAERMIEMFGHHHHLDNDGNGFLIREAEFAHVQPASHFRGLMASGRGMLILPLMRGGEPMARGVYETFPQARLVHFDDNNNNSNNNNANMLGNLLLPQDAVRAIVIVDSVINRGESIRRVLRLLSRSVGADNDRHEHDVFVLTAVTQRTAAESLPREFPRVRFLTLRVSSNQYKGKGGTDTGNRLFGTTS